MVNKPEPGFFKLCMVKGGPYVGAQIEHGPSKDPETGEPLDRSWLWKAWINGRLAADPSPDPMYAGVFRIWHFAQEITEKEYRYLLGIKDWAEKSAPNDPAANPMQPIDHLKTPIPF
jgi:hypothetical protein